MLAGCVYRERVVYRQPPPGAPVVAKQEVVVTGAPPPPVVETVTVAPGPGLFGLAVDGLGAAIGFGIGATGVAHRIEALFGRRIVTFIAMAPMFSSAVAGGN